MLKMQATLGEKKSRKIQLTIKRGDELNFSAWRKY